MKKLIKTISKLLKIEFKIKSLLNEKNMDEKIKFIHEMIQKTCTKISGKNFKEQFITRMITEINLIYEKYY